MTFTAITEGFVLFALGFVLHVFWWRLKRPKDDVRALIASLCLFPSLLAAGIYASRIVPALTGRETAAAILLIILVSATYVMYYPAAQAASPTMLLLVKIGRAGKAGVRQEDLLGAVDEKLLCRDGIANLAQERFAQEQNGTFAVAPRGAVLLRMLNVWRGVLGLKRGRG